MSFKRWIERYLYLKLYFDRAMSHLNIARTLFSLLALLAVTMKSFEIFSWKLFAGVVSLGLIVVFLIGWLDIKLGIFRMDNHIQAQHSPILQEIKRNTKQKRRKKQK